MMRKLLLYSLGLLFFISCSDETELTPTEVKNWFEIIEKENMDVVDQKIYDIWRAYEIGVFYNDTLGREDRGRRDSVGNIIYHYEILDLSYNMTTSSYTNRVTWTPVDVSNATEKARLLPLLNFLDASLLPFIKSAEVHIPAVMITETFRVSNSAKKVYRGFNFLGISLADFENNAESKKLYRAEFINQTCAKKIEKLVAPFYEVAEVALALYSSSPWGSFYYGNSSAMFPFYSEVLANIGYIENYEHEMDSLRTLKADLDIRVSEGELTEDDPEYVRCINGIAVREAAKTNETTWRNEYTRCRPETYGILALNTIWMPSREADLDSYMAAVFTYSLDEFRGLYTGFPLVIERFRILKEILEGAGFDVDAVRESM